jgi:NAD(P)H-dependent FMN reductase
MTCAVLLISGSLRLGSVNVAVLRTAQEIAPPNTTTRTYRAMGDLPHFNPDDDRHPLSPSIASLRLEIARADALLFCTPEYVGGLPGSLKNLLDWTVGGIEMNGKPVGWINAASPAAPAGGEDAYDVLRKAMVYVGARIIEPACIRIPVSRRDVDPVGIIRDDSIRCRIAASLSALTRPLRDHRLL